MKRMITKLVLGGLCLVLVGINFNFNSATVVNGSLVLNNVEALAQDETGDDFICEANANCFNGSLVIGSVKCRGKVSCKSGHEQVTCDGKTHYCVI